MVSVRRSSVALVGDAFVGEPLDLAVSDDVLHTLRPSAHLADEVRCRPPETVIGELDALVASGPYGGLLTMTLRGVIDHRPRRVPTGCSLSPHPLPAAPSSLVPVDGVASCCRADLLDLVEVGGIARCTPTARCAAGRRADPAVVGSDHGRARLAAITDATRAPVLVDLLGVVGPATHDRSAGRSHRRSGRSGRRRRVRRHRRAGRSVGAGEMPLRRVAASDDEVGAHAPCRGRTCPRRRARAAAPTGGGVAHRPADHGRRSRRWLSRGGRGDTGGVASLLVSLGEALPAGPRSIMC